MPLTTDGGGRTRYVSEAFEQVGEGATAIAATVADFDAIAEVLAEASPDEVIRVLTDVEVAKELRRNFIVASRTVELIESGHLEVRTESVDESVPTLVLGSDAGQLVVAVEPDALTRVPVDDEEFVAAAREEFDDRWAEASEFSFRTPSYSYMLDRLAEDIGADVADDVRAVLEAAAGSRVRELDVDPVRICLLVAAKHRVLYYELSRWGADVGVASESKFSREKQSLEEAGLIDTEKVPGDIGRPRQRLVLTDDLVGRDATDLIDTARSALA